MNKYFKQIREFGMVLIGIGIIGNIFGIILNKIDNNKIETVKGKIANIELIRVEDKGEYSSGSTLQLWIILKNNENRFMTILPSFVDKKSELNIDDSVEILYKLDGLNRGFNRIYQLKRSNHIIMPLKNMEKDEIRINKSMIFFLSVLILAGILCVSLSNKLKRKN